MGALSASGSEIHVFGRLIVSGGAMEDSGAIKNNIDLYIGWFKEKLNFISTITDDDIRILSCCSLIDALAKCVYCSSNNRKRFIDLLEQFAEVEIWNRVSIYHIVNGEDYGLVAQDTKLRRYCETKLSWARENDGKIYDYEVDPSICEIEAKYDDEENKKKLREIFRKYKYSTIFYKSFRNGLVHEARITTEFKFDYCEKDVPYYANYSNAGDMNTDKKHLIIPVGFIIRTTRKVIDNVGEWLSKNNINPYERLGIV